MENTIQEYLYEYIASGKDTFDLLAEIKQLKAENEQLKAELEAIKELGDLTEDDIPWLRGEGEDEENR